MARRDRWGPRFKTQGKRKGEPLTPTAVRSPEKSVSWAGFEREAVRNDPVLITVSIE